MGSIHRFRRKRAREVLLQRGRTSRSRLTALLTVLLFASALGVAAVGILSVIVYRSYAHGLKPPEEAIASASVGTSIAYDRNGQYLYEYVDPLGGLRNPKPLSEISPYLIAATIATEDASFYDNPGVNFRGLLRAAAENLTPFGPGFLAGSGGSSITQQLVKNVYIDKDERFDRKITRKLKETVIALELKRNYDDNQILEWYLNQIYYGNFAYGAEAAAGRFFGKSAKDLTLGEAALLAGLPQAPGTYDPTDPAKRDGAKARQLEVLDLMKEHHDNISRIVDLTAEQIDAAKNEPINYIDHHFDIKAPHFVFYVEDQLKKMCNAALFKPPGDISCDKVVTQGGLRITTSLDLGLNDLGAKVLEEEVSANEDRTDGHDASLVAVRPGTGEILAYVGSRDFWREDIDGQVDIASSLQSHGSTMKVFTYLTAFQQGWAPSTYVKDEALYLDAGGGQKRQVNNWNFSYLGTITARKAVSESVNTSAVRTLMDVGADNMRDTAHRLGITDLRQGDCGPTITLGACEVKLVDMTYAFSVLANNGVMKGRPSSEDLPSGFRELDPVSVLKIQDAEGKVVYQYQKPEERQAIDPAYAYMMTDILSNDAINWSRMTIDRPAAVKTGTSEDFRDNVVMGYTPDLAAGVWMGNADNTAMASGTFSSSGTGPMWKRFMTEAHAYLQLPPRPFEKPADIVTSDCGGRQEVFKKDTPVAKNGLCSGPSRGGPTPEPTIKPPVFPTRGSPSATPSRTPVLASPTPSGEAPVPTSAIFRYKVKDGDTVEGIAAKFGVTPQSIIETNHLPPDGAIQAGQVLLISLAGSEGPPGASPSPRH
jgi:membrane peptidoglycan carboxypeptidase